MYRPGISLRGLLTATAMAAAVTACVNAEPLLLSQHFSVLKADPAVRNQIPEDGSCKVAITALADRRSDRVSAGMLGYRPIRGPADGRQWLRNVLEGLTEYRIGVSNGPAAESSTIEIQADLLKAWLSTIQTSGAANTLMTVRYVRQNQPLGERTYRGTATRMNWSSGDNETGRLMDLAFADLLRDMSEDIAGICQIGALPAARAMPPR